MRMGTMRMGMQTVYQLALSAIIFIVLFTCGVLHPSAATAATYYVATTGNDANPGTQAQPFRTIQKGLNVLRASDTLYLRGGTYAESINSNNQTIPSGTSWADAPRIAAYSGETVTLQGTVNLVHAYIKYLIIDGIIVDGGGVSLIHVNFIRLQNGEVKNSPAQGIFTAIAPETNYNEF